MAKAISLNQAKKDLEKLELKLEKLNQKKDECFNNQNKMDDEFLHEELSSNKKYQKLIEQDFELASQIDDLQKEIKNKKAQVKRKEKAKDMAIEKEVEKENDVVQNENDAILIESLEVEGKLWFDKTYGNTYHVARAIINNEYTITHDTMTYGYGDYYETSVAKDMEKLGITGISKDSLWRFCEENNITFSSDKKEGLKRDLAFKDYENRDWYKEVDSSIKFTTKSDKSFKELVDLIEKEYSNSSNESKAIALYIESMTADKKISDVQKRITSEYGINLSDSTTSLVNICDTQMIKDVYGASMDMDISFDFTRKDITLRDIYSGYIDVLNDNIKVFKNLNAEKKIDFFEKRIEMADELIKKYDESKTNDSSESELNKKTTRKNR
jgi:hypothetical protein